MHIAIAAPIATDDIADLLTCDINNAPKGYVGAPLTGVLIKALVKQGYKVSGITTDSSLFPANGPLKLSGPNFDFYLCPARPKAWNFNTYLPGRIIDGFAYEQKHLAKTLSAVRPDIIHAHWTYEFALAAIATGLPHLITCHDSPSVVLKYTLSPYRAIRYLMAKKVFERGINFTAVSKYMAELLNKYTDSMIDVVPNPLAEYVLASGRIRYHPASFKIGFVCNGWNARKNPEQGLKAFAKFRELNPGAELHLFGHDFGTNERAENWCKKTHIASGMFFHGPLPHKKLIAELNNMDLLLHSALEESFGVAIAEAMALGLPIVAGSRSGAIPAVVGADDNLISDCAVLTDVTKVDALVSAIEMAFDSDYMNRSASGFYKGQQYGAEKVVAAYLELYKKVLKKF